MNTSLQATAEDAFIAEMAASLNMLARRTGIRIPNKRIGIFDH